DLLDGLERVSRPLARRHVAVVLVDELDPKTLHAIQYALTIRPEEVRGLHLMVDEERARRLAAEWPRRSLPFPLDMRPCTGRSRGDCLAAYVREHGPDGAQITVVVPGPAKLTLIERLRRGRSWSGLVQPLRALDNVSVAVIREHGGAGHAVTGDRVRVSPRSRHIAVILVGRFDRSVLKAVRYARQIDAMDIRAVHAAVDPHVAAHLAEQWAEVGNLLRTPLDVEECFDRNIARTIREYVERLKSPDAEITVILPRREYPRATQRLLHDHTSRTIARALRDEPHVDVVAVPYHLRPLRQTTDGLGPDRAQVVR